MLTVNNSIYNPVFIAIFCYYIFLTSIVWHCLVSVHVYFRITDARNNDNISSDRHLFFIAGWLIPILAVSVLTGLNSDIFGNASFCWISWKEETSTWIHLPNLLIPLVDLWFVTLSWISQQRAPETAVRSPVASSLRVSLKQLRDTKLPLRKATYTLPFPILIFATAWSASNFNNLFAYSVLCCLMLVYAGLEVYFLYHDSEVNHAWKLEKTRKQRKKKLKSTTAALLSHAVAYSHSGTEDNKSGRTSRILESDSQRTTPNRRREYFDISDVDNKKAEHEKKALLSGNRISNPVLQNSLKIATKASTMSSITSDTGSLCDVDDLYDQEMKEIKKLKELNSKALAEPMPPEKNNSKISWGEDKSPVKIASPDRVKQFKKKKPSTPPPK